MISLWSLLGGSDGDRPKPEETASSNSEPPPLSAEHADLLGKVREKAEADAIRHAEDLLEREFPIVEDAERMANARLADLRVTYTAERGDLEGEKEAIKHRIETAARQLLHAENTLRGAGVPEDELGLPPLGSRRVPLWQAAAAVGIAICAGLIASRLISNPLFLAVAIATAAGLGLWLIFAPPAEAEPEELTRRREHHSEAAAELQRLHDKRARNEAAIAKLDRTTYTAGQSEIAFADRLVAAYASAAFSALPAGTLEGGRGLAAQPRPEIALPEWLRELAEEDE